MSDEIVPRPPGRFIPPAPDAVTMLLTLPPLLQAQRRWVGFDLVPVAGGKPKKIPKIADKPGRKASCTNPATWRSFDDVVRGLRAGSYTAAGFALGADNIVGIDLDGDRWVLDDDGEPTEEAQALVDRCGSYAEMSISGRGIHILVRGNLPVNGRKSTGNAVEMYVDNRFLIVTGRRIDGAATDIRENQAAIDWIHGKYLASGKRREGEATESAESTESAEKTECIEDMTSATSVCSVLSGISVAAISVDDLIARTQPTGPGQRNHRLFDLARGLKFNAGYGNVLPGKLKPLVKRWHARALHNILTKSFDETWADFLRACDAATMPLDFQADRYAAERAQLEPAPAAVEFDSPGIRLLVGICWHLSRFNASGGFYLSSHRAGALLGISHDKALTWLKMLITEKVIELVTTGNERRANRYRYVHGTTLETGIDEPPSVS